LKKQRSIHTHLLNIFLNFTHTLIFNVNQLVSNVKEIKKFRIFIVSWGKIILARQSIVVVIINNFPMDGHLFSQNFKDKSNKIVKLF